MLGRMHGSRWRPNGRVSASSPPPTPKTSSYALSAPWAACRPTSAWRRQPERCVLELRAVDGNRALTGPTQQVGVWLSTWPDVTSVEPCKPTHPCFLRFAVHGRGAWAGLQALCAEHNIGRGPICTLLKLMPRARGVPFGGISSERRDDERPWKQRRVSPPPKPQGETLIFEANAFLTDVLPMPCDKPQGPRSALAKPGRAVAGHRHVSFDLDTVGHPTQCGASLAEAAASDPRQTVVDVLLDVH